MGLRDTHALQVRPSAPHYDARWEIPQFPLNSRTHSVEKTCALHSPVSLVKNINENYLSGEQFGSRNSRPSLVSTLIQLLLFLRVHYKDIELHSRCMNKAVWLTLLMLAEH